MHSGKLKTGSTTDIATQSTQQQLITADSVIVRILLPVVLLLTASTTSADVFNSVTILNNASAPPGMFSPVHGTLMPDGSVLFIGIERQPGTEVAPVTGPKFTARYQVPAYGSNPWPKTQELTPDATPYVCDGNCVIPIPEVGSWELQDTLFCAGHTLLDDGRLLTLGGTRYWNFTAENTAYPDFSLVRGLRYGLFYDSELSSWARVRGSYVMPGATNTHGRWYGTATRLADSRVLLTGGFDQAGLIINEEFIGGFQSYQLSVEIYDPLSPADPYTLISGTTETPVEIFNLDYPHVFQLPAQLPGGFDVLMLGMSGQPLLMAPTTPAKWLSVGGVRPGEFDEEYDPVNGGSSLLLPIRLAPQEWGYNPGAMMVVGGGGADRQSHADIFDVIAGDWNQQRTFVGARRHHPSTVILPDGRIFVIGGHATDMTIPFPTHGNLLTPTASGYSVTDTASMSGSRGYHTVTLLLPDGRVMVAGGRTGGSSGKSDEQPTVEFYEPDYMSVPRPTLTDVPAELHHDEPFLVFFAGASQVSEVVLLSLGSMTHSFDANQRSIQLVHLQLNSSIAAVKIVGGKRFVPPGHYMLFLLDENRIPSVAKIVKVSEAP